MEDKINGLLLFAKSVSKSMIIVKPRIRYDRSGYKYTDGFTVVAETSERLGNSRGVGSRYDYGFMDLDVRSGISVIVLA